MAKKTYFEKLKDPRWQKMRLKVLERDEWMCQSCLDSESMLAVHHRYYEKGKDPWDYPMEALVTLCEECHDAEREMGQEYTTLLLQQLRRVFFADDLRELACGFSCLPPQINFYKSRELAESCTSAIKGVARGLGN